MSEGWKGRTAIGDPLTSGTAFTWAVFIHSKYGDVIPLEELKVRLDEARKVSVSR